MILAGVCAVRAGMTVRGLADTWAPYLTMSEGIGSAQSFPTGVELLLVPCA